MTQTRRARCSCGQLSIVVSGDPTFVAICNCTQCQRRTGSIFGVSAYFSGEQITQLNGKNRVFSRNSDAGRSVEIRFCPDCGSSVYWTGSNAPVSEGIGVAVGCFTEPAFPKPETIAWCAHKYDWAVFPPGIGKSQKQE